MAGKLDCPLQSLLAFSQPAEILPAYSNRQHSPEVNTTWTSNNPSVQHDLDVVWGVPQGEHLGRVCSGGLESSPGFRQTDPAHQFIVGSRSGSF